MEGSLIGYWHAPGGSYYFGLWDYFGCTYLGYDYGVGFGTLQGYPHWVSAGMKFGFPDSPPLGNYFDKLEANGSGVEQLQDELGHQRMVYNAGERAEYRVITSSVSFAGFSETVPYSTQLRLMARMVAFLRGEDETAPEAITGVVTEKTNNSIIISWDVVDEDALGNPEALDCYLIERGTIPFGTMDPVALVLDTSFEDAPWGFGNPDTNYFYAIRAIDTAGNMGEPGMAAEIDYETEDGQ